MEFLDETNGIEKLRKFTIDNVSLDFSFFDRKVEKNASEDKERKST